MFIMEKLTVLPFYPRSGVAVSGTCQVLTKDTSAHGWQYPYSVQN